ncbi:MAG: hypothetical protein ABJD53_13960 [Gammaproteobacteria bacterium]
MKRKWKSSFALIAIMGLTVAACTSQKAPAKLALGDAQKAVVMATTSDTKKYVPDELQALQSTIVGLNASYSIGDYPSVLSGVPPVVVETQGLRQRAAQKKETALKELNAQWGEFASELPLLVNTVTTRVEVLSEAKRAPKGVDLGAAQSALTDANGLWDKAKISFDGGNVEEAVDVARNARFKAETAASDVKLPLRTPAMAAK